MSSDWGNVSRGELIGSLRGAVVAAVTGASIAALALLYTDKWEDLGDPVIPTIASLGGVVAVVVAILAERVKGWRIIVPLYGLVLAGFLWLNLDDDNDDGLDNAVIAAMVVLSLALAAYLAPQLIRGAAHLQTPFSRKPVR